MESYLPLGGFQMPFQRRLSRLYNDTKKSSDFVKEPVQNAEDPEMKALHRKLRIQKDRLVSWGLEWSDPSQAAEIDESLSKAGLSEVVGSIMSTIKDILAEAEPLWQSSRRLAGGEKENEKASGDKKIPLVIWDKGRFEDLIRDLTVSIDTLYDLSRTRSAAALSSQTQRGLYKSTSTSEDLRAFESTRMQRPQEIDPQTLTSLEKVQAVSTTGSPVQSRSREVVFMSKQAFSELTQQSGRQPYSPLLLEFADFDPMYSATGIMPSMSRFERLSSGLQTEPQRSPGSWTGLPRLLGYFEDMEHSRLGLVYQFPPTFKPVSLGGSTHNSSYSLYSLADLLARPDFEPKLEAKFRLAYNLANTVFDMHARGITHGNLTDSNVSFCNGTTDQGTSGTEVDIRRPLVSSFDVFPDAFQEPTGAVAPLYRHPLDPKTVAQATQATLPTSADSKTFDLYSLAMLLLSIGLWTNLENLVPNAAATSIPDSVLEQLAIRCGTLYMKAVQSCWNAADRELAGKSNADQILSDVQVKASRYLEACCILDSVESLDERQGEETGESVSASTRSRQREKPNPGSSKAVPPLPVKRSVDVPTTLPAINLASRTSPPDATANPLEAMPGQISSQTSTLPEAPPKPPSPKLRLFPHVPLPPETVEQWNAVLMPQINQALRHFYRKHPESVEISLESIGESPKETRPTVLVVCTSVGKVRMILKRKLGMLFDGTTGFGLKVCRGQVLRSRNRGVRRSMAKPDPGDKDDVTAANGDFQERPQNGASIGAWIGNRHLPPVSFGGMVMIDEKPYGMTVHHMLDDPEQDSSTITGTGEHNPVLRSGAGAESETLPDLAAWYEQHYAEHDFSDASSATGDFACEFSDTDSESDAFSESAVTSSYEDSDAESDSDDKDPFAEAGDIPGIEPGCGDGYIVTQPALDDVTDGFYPSPETQDEDHLDTFSLGEVYASSGIRRREDDNGLIHEIDWALFEFTEERQPDENSIPRLPSGLLSRRISGSGTSTASPIHPTSVVPTTSLPGLEVQCIARTSGLQTGLILPAITSVKIHGRTSPSHTYQVTRTAQPQASSNTGSKPKSPALPMGIPGDSGAWIIDRQRGQLCGHVLAWSGRKRVAYICPMDVLLLDIAETLDAGEVRLPGGEAVVRTAQAEEEDNDEHEDRRDPRVEETDEEEEEHSVEHGRQAEAKNTDDIDDLGDLLEEEAVDGEAHGLRSYEPKTARMEMLTDDMGKMHLGQKEMGVQGY